MAKYLDEAGLSRLVEGIKEKFIGQSEVIDVETDLSTPKLIMETYERLQSSIELNKPIFVAYASGTMMVPCTATLNASDSQIVITYSVHAGSADSASMIIGADGTVEGSELNLIDENGIVTEENVGLVYDATERKFYVAVSGQKTGAGVDATPFIKDGMLEDVDTIEVTAENLAEIQAVKADAAAGDKLIKFVWNTDGGSKTDYIKTSDIAVDPDTANTEVSEDIIIAGGPLAEEVKSVFSAYKDADGNTVIPKDMTLQEVLTLLVCKELWPTAVTTSDAKLVSTIAAPTITMSTTTVEVGTAVEYSVKNGASNYTATPHKASGFTYGYSAADDNSKDSSATSVSATFDMITDTNPTIGAKTCSMTVTDTVNNSEQTTTCTTTAGSETITGTMVVAEGTNTVTATGTSNKYTGTCSALPTYYGCSNTGKTNDGTKNYPSTAKAEVKLTSTAVTSTQAKKSVTAQYKYFVGYSANTEYSQFDSAAVRALTAKSGYMTKDGTTTVVAATATAVASDGRSIVVAVPSKYTLKTITNGLGADIKANFTSVGTVKVKIGGGTGAEEDYTVYVYPITNGAVVEYKGLTVGK